MPKLQSVDGDTAALRLVMADRLNEAINRHPELFRPGRGRLSDFVERYGMMRTVAHRILTGATFPSPPLLIAIAQDTKLSIDWFYARGSYWDPSFRHVEDDGGKEELSREIPIYGADGFAVHVPVQMLPHSTTSSLLLARVGAAEFEPYVGVGDYLLIERTQSVDDPASYYLGWIGSDTAKQVMVTIRFGLRSADPCIVTTSAGQSATYAADEIHCEGDSAPDEHLFILGKVVGRIAFDANGIGVKKLRTYP